MNEENCKGIKLQEKADGIFCECTFVFQWFTFIERLHTEGPQINVFRRLSHCCQFVCPVVKIGKRLWKSAHEQMRWKNLARTYCRYRKELQKNSPCFPNNSKKVGTTRACHTPAWSQIFLSMRNECIIFNPLSFSTVSEIGTHESQLWLVESARI